MSSHFGNDKQWHAWSIYLDLYLINYNYVSASFKVAANELFE